MRKKTIKGIFDSAAEATPAHKPEIKNNMRKQTIFVMNEQAVKQLDFMALDNNTTRQALLIEAVNDLFMKHNKPPIA